jgi:parallel beta-helix repeat protein
MYRLGLFLFIILIQPAIIFSASYYVDVFGNDQNDGTSVNTPWQTISKVNSVIFLPGDQILFKRGGIWFETLVVPSSGTAQSPIVFGDYGDGELPVIDGTNVRSSCIYVHTKNHIIIKNFSVKNNNGNGTIWIMYGVNVSVQNNIIYATGKGGIFIENSSNCLLAGNSITTPDGFFDNETDGIYSQRNILNKYEKNKIIIKNSHPVYHVDGIQSYLDESLQISNNHIIQDNSKQSSQGIYSTFSSGANYFYNNVVDCPFSTSSVVGFVTLSANSALYLVHNTLIGKGANIISISGSPYFLIQNNIFYAISPNHAIINIGSITGSLEMDYNLYYNHWNPIVLVYQGAPLTFTQWQHLGYDVNGVISDPSLKEDYTLNGGSPAIDMGSDMGLTYRYDKAGTLRPQLAGVDIGAYEVISEIQSSDSIPLPVQFSLMQNYPNPFNPATTIKYYLPTSTHITLEVFDILGSKVSTLAEGYTTAGEHTVQMNNDNLPAGVYLYRLVTEYTTQTRKMILLK